MFKEQMSRHSINSVGELLVIAEVYGNNDMFLRHIYDSILRKKETC